MRLWCLLRWRQFGSHQLDWTVIVAVGQHSWISPTGIARPDDTGCQRQPNIDQLSVPVIGGL
jgi:hypothetical protein